MKMVCKLTVFYPKNVPRGTKGEFQKTAFKINEQHLKIHFLRCCSFCTGEFYFFSQRRYSLSVSGS